MKQKWRDLLFLHWAVDLDLFDGAAYVGLVPFTMRGVRPRGLPPMKGQAAFHEIHVSLHVHFHGGDPGVWFLTLDAANWFEVRIAQSVFHLPYCDTLMFLDRE